MFCTEEGTWHRWNFSAPHSESVPGEFCPLSPPRYTPVCKSRHRDVESWCCVLSRVSYLLRSQPSCRGAGQSPNWVVWHLRLPNQSNTYKYHRPLFVTYLETGLPSMWVAVVSKSATDVLRFLWIDRAITSVDVSGFESANNSPIALQFDCFPWLYSKIEPGPEPGFKVWWRPKYIFREEWFLFLLYV